MAKDPSWRQKLKSLIGVDPEDSVNPKTNFSLDAVLGRAQQLGCRTIIVESDYVCSDYLSEFEAYYCKLFASYESKCQRVHFFRTEFTQDGMIDFLSSAVPQDYLGYSVIRPIDTFRVGRTVLKADRTERSGHYAVCQEAFQANLSGLQLSVEGMPFIQQDTNVGVCGQAALWMTMLYMHQRYGYPRCLPSDITEAAVRKLTLGPIREGLTPLQVVEALKTLGYAPLLFDHRDPDVTARTIYAYVESEIPVILGVKLSDGGHATVVIGHDFEVKLGSQSDCTSNIDWIGNFIVHDDAYGPYRLTRRANGHKSDQHTPYTLEQSMCVIVPAPAEVKLRADDVQWHLRALRSHLNEILQERLKAVSPPLPEDKIRALQFKPSELNSLVFRTYLRLSNDFKAQIGSAEGMSSLFKHVYRSMRLPRYVWVTEISRASLINKREENERLAIGEIVMDSTADRHRGLDSYLSIHLQGIMVVKRPRTSKAMLHLDSEDRPYRHLIHRSKSAGPGRRGNLP